ncbi:response regulator [Altericroceibacterium xinjiangense]|uniref:response regulator n=1 Tax=Altericroceibacterium xinjiangense TaxID=762261 RepID=UPI000F7E9002|nr:response regulator [Altericroceibacterium xinjiangense]
MSNSAANPPRNVEILLVAVAILASIALVFIATEHVVPTIAYAGGLLALGLIVLAVTRRKPGAEDQAGMTPDWAVTLAAIERQDVGIAITDRANRLVCANGLFESWFGFSGAPPRLPVNQLSAEELARIVRSAWRDGQSDPVEIEDGQRRWTAQAQRAGRADDYLVWRFAAVEASEAVDPQHVAGVLAGSLSRGGIELALVGPGGAIRAASSGLARRAAGDEEASMAGQDFASVIRAAGDRVYFTREGRKGSAQTLVEIPMADSPADGDVSDSLMVLIDSSVVAAAGEAKGPASPTESLFDHLPLGLAVTDRDGRFLTANAAFRQAAGIEAQQALPPYPSDLVLPHDKAAVSDAVRRCGQSRGLSGRIDVRLRNQPGGTGALAFAGMRGPGAAAVLLTLASPGQVERPDAAPVRVTESSTGGGGEILLIGHEETVRTVAERALTRENHRVTVAVDAEEGLHLLSDHAFDMVIADALLPGTEGASLVTEIHAIRANLPILFLADYAEEQLLRDLTGERADVLAKPFGVQQIAARAAALLQRT